MNDLQTHHIGLSYSFRWIAFHVVFARPTGALPFAGFELFDSLSTSKSTSSAILFSHDAAAFANHRPPPSSNQPRWPPPDVATMTAYSFCIISSYGAAKSLAIGSSFACTTNKGICTLINGSMEEASR